MGRTTFYCVAPGDSPDEALDNAMAGNFRFDELPDDIREDKDGLVMVAQGVHTDEEAEALATALEDDSRFSDWWDPIAYVELSPGSQRRFAFFGWMRG